MEQRAGEVLLIAAPRTHVIVDSHLFLALDESKQTGPLSVKVSADGPQELWETIRVWDPVWVAAPGSALALQLSYIRGAIAKLKGRRRG